MRPEGNRTLEKQNPGGTSEQGNSCGRRPVHSEAGTCVGIWKVKGDLIYDSLENFAMQERDSNLRD